MKTQFIMALLFSQLTLHAQQNLQLFPNYQIGDKIDNNALYSSLTHTLPHDFVEEFLKPFTPTITSVQWHPIAQVVLDDKRTLLLFTNDEHANSHYTIYASTLYKGTHRSHLMTMGGTFGGNIDPKGFALVYDTEIRLSSAKEVKIYSTSSNLELTVEDLNNTALTPQDLQSRIYGTPTETVLKIGKKGDLKD